MVGIIFKASYSNLFFFLGVQKYMKENDINLEVANNSTVISLIVASITKV